MIADDKNQEIKQQENKKKPLYPDTFLYVITAAFPEKYTSNEKILKERFGGVLIKDKSALDADEEFYSPISFLVPSSEIDDKDYSQIRLVFDTHGSEECGQQIYTETLELTLRQIYSYLHGELTKQHPETKVYIENLSCHGASKPLNSDDKFGQRKTMEGLIEDIFGEDCNGRIFYAKLKNKDYSMRNFLKDNGAFAHIMVEDSCNETLSESKEKHKNGETDPAFQYYYLKNNKLHPYMAMKDLLEQTTSATAEDKLKLSRAVHHARKTRKDLDLLKSLKGSRYNSEKNSRKVRKYFKGEEDMKIKQDNEQKAIKQKQIRKDIKYQRRSVASGFYDAQMREESKIKIKKNLKMLKDSGYRPKSPEPGK